MRCSPRRWARPRLWNKKSTGERRAELLAMGVEILKARKARSLGLDKDPAYVHRRDDFLRNLTTAQLVTKLRKEYIPTDEAFAKYYNDHQDEFTIPERRRLQQIVVKTEKEAKALREEILKETTDELDPFYKLSFVPWRWSPRSCCRWCGSTAAINGSGTMSSSSRKRWGRI